jgi:hypothetical protein
MSDEELVKRLRKRQEFESIDGYKRIEWKDEDALEAADRIEELTAKLAKAVELLIVCRDMFGEVAHPSDPLSKMLNDTLAEIEGEKTW